ncbi:peptidogalycan biosysnthesis protein [Streptomyces sp. LMG1-1-1.1]|uniref:peptidogalycan biosysnthesis protein n=1 Tax=Streptomyces sp. LMG1-1-1.1 TaxID=3135245 RepID=UPI0034655B27
MNVTLARTLAEVPLAEWDALAGGSFYAGHDWAAYQELDPHARAYYVLVRDEEGALVAAASAYLVAREGSGRYRPSTVFPDLGLAPEGPVLLVGNRRGHANRLLLDRAHPHADRALDQLVAAVDRLAADEAGGHAWWLYLGEEDARRLLPYARLPRPRLLAADCAISLPGDGFDDYLAAATGNQRRQIRKDRRTFLDAGYTYRAEAFRDVWRPMGPLIASHQSHHGHQAADEAMTELMRQQAETCGRNATVHTCGRGPAMVGCALTFTTSTQIAARAYGFDHSRGASAAEYFELFYYRPIEQAYAAGVREVHLGIGTLQPKIRRGARVLLLWGLVTGAGLPAADDGAAAVLNRDAWERTAAQLGDRPDALSDTLLPLALA